MGNGLTCAGCGHENTEGVRFCTECGTALAPKADSRTCSACGHVNEEGVRFCGECGKPLGDAPASAPVGPSIKLSKESYGAEDGEIIVTTKGISPKMKEEGVFLSLAKATDSLDNYVDGRMPEIGECQNSFPVPEEGGSYEFRLFKQNWADEESFVTKIPVTIIGFLICQACGHTNPPGRKFCAECGSPL